MGKPSLKRNNFSYWLKSYFLNCISDEQNSLTSLKGAVLKEEEEFLLKAVGVKSANLTEKHQKLLRATKQMYGHHTQPDTVK